MSRRALRGLASAGVLAGVVWCVAGVEAADAERLKRAVDSLRRSQDASGLLRYDFDFLAGGSSGQNDPVRQTGVVAFLAEYLVASGDSSISSAVHRALERFEALSLPIGKSRMQAMVEWSGLLAVPAGRHTLARALDRLDLLYQPIGDGAVFGLEREYRHASSGATAMALLAELQYADATGDTRFAAARTRWLHGLAALHVPGLGFRVTPTMIHVSPFADGEAWLALAYHERRRPGHPVVDAILNAVEERLMMRYEASFAISFYQWGTMAAAVRWDTTKRARFLSFIEQQAVEALTWLSTPRATNTCATIEGLVTAARVLREAGRDAALLGRIEQRVDDEMRKNYELQILPKAGRLHLGADIYIASPRLKEFDGAFVHERHRPYTRIDFTGHCLSAMVKRQYGGRHGRAGGGP